MSNDVAHWVGTMAESTLAQCETAIQDANAEEQRAGAIRAAAFLRIHRGELWRAGHKSFIAYCQKRWGIEKTHAYRILEFAGHVEGASKNSPRGDKAKKSLPSTQSARAAGSVSQTDDAPPPATEGAYRKRKAAAKKKAKAAAEEPADGDKKSAAVTVSDPIVVRDLKKLKLLEEKLAQAEKGAGLFGGAVKVLHEEMPAMNLRYSEWGTQINAMLNMLQQAVRLFRAQANRRRADRAQARA